MIKANTGLPCRVQRLARLVLAAGCVLAAFVTNAHAAELSRLLVLTDIGNEPDDSESMVRLLVTANSYEIEGLIATTSIHLKQDPAPELIRERVRAYGAVRDNLLLHAPGFPEEARLMGLIKVGSVNYGMQGVGPGQDSAGSEWIIQTVDRKDPRPVWVTAWGGPNTLAQALWKVRETRDEKATSEFVKKLRVYAISDQDDSGPWMRKEFPDLFYIVSPGFGYQGAYGRATWSGISGDRRKSGGFEGANFAIVDNPWLTAHVRENHGPLGELYPPVKFIMEGDTPSFLYLFPNGLGNPEHPNWGSWGGRYEYYKPPHAEWRDDESRPIWTDAEDTVQGSGGKWYTGNRETIWRWREAYQNEFAARMDWCVKSFAEANHPPEVKLGGKQVLTVKPGAEVKLSAKDTSDPDGDALSFAWSCYKEAGTYGGAVDIQGASGKKAHFTAPEDIRAKKSIHILLAVTDAGAPSLTRYARTVVWVEGPAK